MKKEGIQTRKRKPKPQSAQGAAAGQMPIQIAANLAGQSSSAAAVGGGGGGGIPPEATGSGSGKSKSQKSSKKSKSSNNSNLAAVAAAAATAASSPFVSAYTLGHTGAILGFNSPDLGSIHARGGSGFNEEYAAY